MKPHKIVIERYSHGEEQTIGSLFIVSKFGHILFKCDTLELPWKDNKKKISCIPTGTYTVKKRFSEKYKNHLHITGVTNRSYILIHSGNFNTHTLGCVLVGELAYINDDDIVDVGNSKKTLKNLLKHIKTETITIEVVSV